jgi:hypothetical protein
MPKRKFFVATDILLFYFELFIGDRRQKRRADNPASYQPFNNIGRFVAL